MFFDAAESLKNAAETKRGLLSRSKTPRRQKRGYWAAQNRRGDKNDATEPLKNAAETKMMLLYPTKPSRRPKWCYCTLQNHRGGQNDATVPYKTSSEAKMALLYPTKPSSEAKMALLYPTKPSRRQKWGYCTLQNHRGDKNDVTVPYSDTTKIKKMMKFCRRAIQSSKARSEPMVSFFSS